MSASMGACGGTMAAAILYPRTCKAIYDDFKAGRISEAVELQARLLPVSDALTRRFGVPGLKAAMASRGMTGGLCRPPLRPLSNADRTELLQILDASGLDKSEGR